MIKINNALTVNPTTLTNFPTLHPSLLSHWLHSTLLPFLLPCTLFLVRLFTFTLFGWLPITPTKTAREGRPCLIRNDEKEFPPRFCVLFPTFRKMNSPHFCISIERHFSHFFEAKTHDAVDSCPYNMTDPSNPSISHAFCMVYGTCQVP